MNTVPSGESSSALSVTRRNLRGRRGGLKDMPNMPLDILIEIFGFLHPRDLLNLARTTRAFRAFLMSRTSSSFWKRARQSVEGLPDCPPHLSEPAYVNLLFFPHCHNCLTGNIQRIIYDFSVRYCRRCKKDMLVKIDDTMYSFFENVENTTDMHEEFLTTTRLMNRDDFEYTYLHAPEWSDFQQVWGTLTDTEAVIGYIQERIAFVKSIKQWSEVLYTWKTAQVMDRADELRQLRTERLQTLLAYLRQEGWEEELELISIDDYVRLTETPFARRASKLTARSWFTIREDAHAFMSDVQATRLLNRRRRALYCRFNILSDLIDDFYRVRGAVRQPEWDINPGIVDLALSPGLRAILDAPGDSPPANLADITDLAQVVATIGWAMHNWSEAVKAELVKQVRTVVQDLGEVPDPLSLALAIFSCRTCHGAPRIPPLCFPQLLAHPCLRRLNGVTSPDTSIYVATAYEYCNPGCGPLTLDRLTVDPGMVQRLRSVIQAMGLDPLRATRAELDSSGVRMTCSTCFAQRPGDTSGFLCEAFDWMRALTHSGLPMHTDLVPCSWRVLTSDQAIAVRLRESQLQQIATSQDFDPSNHENGQRLGCRLCTHNCIGAWSMAYHLLAHHSHVGNDPMALRECSYIHVDSVPPSMPPVRVYSCSGGGFAVV